MGNHNSKHIQNVGWQEHGSLIAFFGRKTLFEYSQYLIVNISSYEYFLNLAEIRAVMLLHREPERHVYAREDKNRVT
jgi:hypothetical protein